MRKLVPLPKNNVELSSILGDPTKVAAVLSSSLRNVLEERGQSRITPLIWGLQWKDGVVTIRTNNPLINTELLLFRAEIQSALEKTLSRFGYGAKIRIVFR